jgi:hypothetical protein
MGKENKVLVVFFLVMVLLMSFASAGIFDWFKKGITGKASQQFNLTANVGNNAPQIIYIETASRSVTEDGTTSVFFNVTAYDSDGSGNLNHSSVSANFTRGDYIRLNSSCVLLEEFGTFYANYSCTILLWYFDESGQWNASSRVLDLSNGIGSNRSLFQYNQFGAITIQPSEVAFPALNPGASNTTASGPLILNNTGNLPFTVITVNTTNLVGDPDNTRALYAGNFSFGNNTGSSLECGASTSTQMQRGVNVTIENAVLGIGNHSLNNGFVGQEQLYLCLRFAGSELTSQDYNTNEEGAWRLETL